MQENINSTHPDYRAVKTFVNHELGRNVDYVDIGSEIGVKGSTIIDFDRNDDVKPFIMGTIDRHVTAAPDIYMPSNHAASILQQHFQLKHERLQSRLESLLTLPDNDDAIQEFIAIQVEKHFTYGEIGEMLGSHHLTIENLHKRLPVISHAAENIKNRMTANNYEPPNPDCTFLHMRFREKALEIPERSSPSQEELEKNDEQFFNAKPVLLSYTGLTLASHEQRQAQPSHSVLSSSSQTQGVVRTQRHPEVSVLSSSRHNLSASAGGPSRVSYPGVPSQRSVETFGMQTTARRDIIPKDHEDYMEILNYIQNQEISKDGMKNCSFPVSKKTVDKFKNGQDVHESSIDKFRNDANAPEHPLHNHFHVKYKKTPAKQSADKLEFSKTPAEGYRLQSPDLSKFTTLGTEPPQFAGLISQAQGELKLTEREPYKVPPTPASFSQPYDSAEKHERASSESEGKDGPPQSKRQRIQPEVGSRAASSLAGPSLSARSSSPDRRRGITPPSADLRHEGRARTDTSPGHSPR